MLFDLDVARDIYFSMRLRIAELNQRFKREMKLDPFQGRFKLEKFRAGNTGLARFSFDMDNRAITGELTAMISKNPVSSTNFDTIRS